MDTWLEQYTYLDETRPSRVPPCNTVACFAGWMRMEIFPYTDFDDFDVYHPSLVTSEFLGLTDEECWKLFHVNGWPNEFSIAYNAADEDRNYVTRATITVDRIRYFMEHRR